MWGAYLVVLDDGIEMPLTNGERRTSIAAGSRARDASMGQPMAAPYSSTRIGCGSVGGPSACRGYGESAEHEQSDGDDDQHA